MARRRAVLILGAVGVAAVTGVVLVSVRTGEEGLSLDTVPGGVSVHRMDDGDVFLARDGQHVVAFVDSAQHMPREKLWWCQTEHVFAAPTHGETFDAQGHHIGGPASRDLDRLAVTVRPDGKITIDSSKVLAGAAPPTPFPRPAGIPDLAAQWPPGFCRSHLAA